MVLGTPSAKLDGEPEACLPVCATSSELVLWPGEGSCGLRHLLFPGSSTGLPG